MRFWPVLQQFVVGVVLQEQSERLGVRHGRGRLLLLFRRDPQQVFDGHVRRRRPGLLAAVLRWLLMVRLWRVVAVLAVRCCRCRRRCRSACALVFAQGHRVFVLVVVIIDQQRQQLGDLSIGRVVSARRRIPDDAHSCVAAATITVPFVRQLVHLVPQRRPGYTVYDGRTSRAQLATLDVPKRLLQLVFRVSLPAGHVTGLFHRLRSVKWKRTILIKEVSALRRNTQTNEIISTYA